MTETLVLERPTRAAGAPTYHISSGALLSARGTPAVDASGESIKFNVEKMETGRFYTVELKGEPYLIRKVSDDVVDVYGLVE